MLGTQSDQETRGSSLDTPPLNCLVSREGCKHMTRPGGLGAGGASCEGGVIPSLMRTATIEGRGNRREHFQPLSIIIKEPLLNEFLFFSN